MDPLHPLTLHKRPRKTDQNLQQTRRINKSTKQSTKQCSSGVPWHTCICAPAAAATSHHHQPPPPLGTPPDSTAPSSSGGGGSDSGGSTAPRPGATQPQERPHRHGDSWASAGEVVRCCARHWAALLHWPSASHSTVLPSPTPSPFDCCLQVRVCGVWAPRAAAWVWGTAPVKAHHHCTRCLVGTHSQSHPHPLITQTKT